MPLAAAPAIIDWLESASAELGLELARSKCAGYCPALGAALADEPAWQQLGFKIGRHKQADGSLVGYGIEIAGTPLGDAAFIAAYASDAVDGQLGAMDKIHSALCPVDTHSAHIMTYYCCLPLIDHVLQHVAPSIIGGDAARFDAAVLHAVESYVPGLSADALVADAAALPARKNGLGLRRRTVLARASFVATCVRSIPLLIDRDTNPPDAQILASTAGFLPQLASVLGAGSFNEGHEQQRFATFLQSGAPLARAMGECWAQLQAEQPGAVDGPLAAPPAAIGFDAAKGTLIAKFQHALTVVREDHAYSDVDTRHRALPPRDQRRLAWLSNDPISSALVTSIPTLACRLNSAEFSEALTQHCGLPSPACAAVRGASIRGRPLDVYGNALSGMQTAGGHWNDHHDNIARFIVGQARDNGLGAAYEPQHAYTDTLPRGARGVFSGLSRDGTDNGAPGQRGITPDLRVRAAVGVEMHYDVKVVHVGTSTYPDTNGAAAARGAAVNTRARRVVSEYERHARKIDAHCAGTAPNDVGPVLRRLREVGITGIAFGAFGEASDDAHRLLKVIAVAGAEARWADAMASSAFAYRSTLIAQMKRLWGCFLARENARLKIARLEHVSGANNRTHAARGPSRAQRARDDANFFLFHQHGARSSPSSWRGG